MPVLVFKSDQNLKVITEHWLSFDQVWLLLPVSNSIVCLADIQISVYSESWSIRTPLWFLINLLCLAFPFSGPIICSEK